MGREWCERERGGDGEGVALNGIGSLFKHFLSHMCQHQFLRTHTKAYSKPELFQLTALVLNYCVELTPVLDFANSMAPHLTKKELDIMRDLKVDKKWTPLEIHAKITSQREKKNIAPPDLTTVHNDKKRCRHTMIGIVVANFVVFLFLLFLLVVALVLLAVLIGGVGCLLLLAPRCDLLSEAYLYTFCFDKKALRDTGWGEKNTHCQKGPQNSGQNPGTPISMLPLAWGGQAVVKKTPIPVNGHRLRGLQH